MSHNLTTSPDLTSPDTPLPPHDLAAEQCVLGAMMLAEDAILDVTARIRVDDFYRPAHATIYQVVLDLFAAGQPTDAIAVSAELASRNMLTKVGGAPYLHTLIAGVPTAANAGYYAEIVAEQAGLRRLVEVGMRLTQLGFYGTQGADVADVLAKAQTELGTALDDRAHGGYVLLSDVRADRLAALDDLQAGRVEPGLATGFVDLDAVTNGGWKPGQLVVIAARPGVGKSTLAVDMARTASLRNGKTSVIFSLEMSQAELWTRLLAAEARVRLRDMQTPGALTPTDYRRIIDAADRIDAGGPLIVDDTPNLTVSQVRATARRIQGRHRLDLVVVDYLQLLTSSRRAENRQVEVSEFSRQLKILAKELNVPVLALSQLNRGPEQRADKRPMLSDLRESGALEQDSDVVVLMHRPEMYDPDSPRLGEADLILAKHRSGPTSTVTVAQQLHLSRFVDLATP